MPKGVRKGLTREKILAASFAIVDEGGPDALTMRTLASRLGVATMAVYNHYRDRNDLLDALADQVFRQIPTPPGNPRASAWKSRLRSLVIGAHQLASGHPHLYRLAMTRPQKPASAFELTTEALQALRLAGLSDQQAVTAYHTLLMVLQGFPFWEVGFSSHRLACEGARPLLYSKEADQQFEAVVDWLLDCVAATASASRPAVTVKKA